MMTSTSMKSSTKLTEAVFVFQPHYQTVFVDPALER